MIDEWSGFADLLANLIEKYASELDVENLPAPAVPLEDQDGAAADKKAVSYTHLTLPTMRS